MAEQQGSFRKIATFKPLRESESGSIEVNITDGEMGKRLDIRQWLKNAGYKSYTGPTKNGVSLSLDEVMALLTQMPSILVKMKAEQNASSSQGASAVTASDT